MHAFEDYNVDIDCPECGGEGGWHDCGEDTCCCANPDEDDWWVCDACQGTGGVLAEGE